MKIKVLQKEGERTKLLVPHENGRTTFLRTHKDPEIHPYFEVQRKGDSNLITPPTMAETISLIYGAFNSNNFYSREIRDMFTRRRIWGFTGNLFVPDEGVYIQDSPEICDGKLVMNKSDLVKKLEANDKNVRFVPFGYKIGDQTPRELRENQYILALAGEEGAEKLAKIANKHKDKPSLLLSDFHEGYLTGFAALTSEWWRANRLTIEGNYYNDWNSFKNEYLLLED